MAVRKLLVASQKGGVGKTTTSINLAAAAARAGARVLLLDADPLSSISASLNLPEHPRRLSLRGSGSGLPGALSPGVVPGLDVLSPYEDGGCSDDELDRLLALLASPSVREGYDCLVVDAPPFMGANPGQLLATCDEFVLVMRAEPMAYRTLPAFLEMVQRARRGDNGILMRGILLTLLEGESPGGRWERELRGRFGSRILPQVVPFDEEVGKSRGVGQVLSHAHPDSPASAQYHSLAANLGLAADADGKPAAGESPLLAVAVTARQASPATPVPAAAAAPAPAISPEPPASVVTPELPAPAVPELTPAAEASPVAPETEPEVPAVTAPKNEILAEVSAAPPPPQAPPAPVRPSAVLRRPAPSRPLPLPPLRRPVSEPELPALDTLIDFPMNPPPLPGRKSGEKAAAQPPSPKEGPKAGPRDSGPAKPKAKPAATADAPGATWLVWVGLAMVAGIGLRFVKLPDAMLPVAVGVCVAAAVVIAMRLSVSTPKERYVPRPPGRPPVKPRQPETRRSPPARPAGKKDTHARLAALSRYAPPRIHSDEE